MHSAIDLSLRPALKIPSPSKGILKPIPRQSWASLWYRTIWPTFEPPRAQVHLEFIPSLCQELGSENSTNNISNSLFKPITKAEIANGNDRRNPTSFGTLLNGEQETCLEVNGVILPGPVPRKSPDSCNSTDSNSNSSEISHPLLDIAACDGPVHFERISNPNFALTVQHCSSSSTDNDGNSSSTIPNTNSICTTNSIPTTTINETKSIQSSRRSTKNKQQCNTTITSSSKNFPAPSSTKAIKIYTCIYCHQNFKSLFCYQKHKKRHINPVSVDVSGSGNNILSENTTSQVSSAKYLNVQFFPCKICGCKFPSYYFVHKHIKNCH